ncbi:hypothetical protein ABIE85_008818 [Bradyrhizobium diazoefficiens]|jgi:hypothetical protein
MVLSLRNGPTRKYAQPLREEQLLCSRCETRAVELPPETLPDRSLAYHTSAALTGRLVRPNRWQSRWPRPACLVGGDVIEPKRTIAPWRRASAIGQNRRSQSRLHGLHDQEHRTEGFHRGDAGVPDGLRDPATAAPARRNPQRPVQMAALILAAWSLLSRLERFRSWFVATRLAARQWHCSRGRAPARMRRVPLPRQRRHRSTRGFQR